MENDNVMFKALPNFLSLFNFSIQEKEKELLYKLKNGYIVNIYDEDLNPVGKLFYSDGKVVIQAMLWDASFNAFSFYDETDSGYKYSIKKIDSNDKLTGEYKIEKGFKLDGIIIKNKMKLYKNGEFIANCKFDTLKNLFKLYNRKTNEGVKHRNNELVYYNNRKITTIVNENGNFFYYIFSGIETDNLGGYLPLKAKIKNYDYTIYEVTMGKILTELDSDYFSFLDMQKKLFNDFHENLFENLACSSLKNFNKRQLAAILDVDFSKHGSCYKKKK